MNLSLKAAKIFVAPFVIALLFACNNHQTLKEKQSNLYVGKIDSTYKYTCPEIGWQTMLPKDWNLLTKEQTNDMNAKGKDLLEKSTGKSIDMSNLEELVNMRKNNFNTFLSTIEKYDSSLFPSVSAYNKYVDDLIENAYTNKKIKFDDKEDSATIDGIVFHTLELHLYAPDTKDLILTQKMYSAILNGYSFSMTANYNNEADKQTLMNVINSSTFTR